MKRYLWLICLVNIFLFSQSNSNEFNAKLYRFVYDYTINNQLDSNLISLKIDSIYDGLSELELPFNQKNEFAHLLYRTSVILDGYSSQSLDIGRLSLVLSENDKSDPNSKYYSNYYKKDAKNFNFWIRTINVFSGVDDDFDEAVVQLLKIKNVQTNYLAFLMHDKIEICLKVKKDIPAAKVVLKKLVDITKSKTLLKDYANLNFKNGFYEDYIDLSPQLIEYNISNSRRLMRAYVKTGNFTQANSVLQQIEVDSTDWDLNIQSAHIYFYMLNKSINIDLFENHDLYYNYKPKMVFNPIEFSQYIYMTELLINQSNHVKTIDYINKHLKDNDLTQDEYRYFRAIIFWKEKDYFNAKRIIHNLLNNNNDLDEKYSNNALLVLSHIAYLTNDRDNFTDYLEQIDKEFIKPEWMHILAFLELSNS